MYTVTKILYPGSQGLLCRAQSDDGTRPVLLCLAPEQYTPCHVEWLRNELSLAEKLPAASVIHALSLDTCQGRPALVLEDFDGAPLSTLLGAAMETECFLDLACAAAAALNEIHRSGIVHRALEPGVILVGEKDHAVRVTGFGMAAALPCHDHPVDMTAQHHPYMAPEQTGRTNRLPDHRSDLYALGAIFYRMLVARPPFEANDALGWIHCHIARTPQPPADAMPSVPPQLSALVMRLLAKEPEHRYQSAEGLLHDLETCRAQWLARGRIDTFPLAQQDRSDHFALPQKLYGRDREIAVLRHAFERVISEGRPELVLIGGYSGIGKSALVGELYQPAVRENAFFATGKFDQYKRDIPYAIMVQAFTGLVLELLTQSEERVLQWRQSLQDALGVNAQLIIDVIPPVGLIIGQQPPVPALPPTAARNRFSIVFRQFIGVFAQQGHPLVLFLDDLQWADPASLLLLQGLLSHPDMRYFLPVCAYRSNEAGAIHPFLLGVDALRESGITVTELVLEPLPEQAVTGLVADTLHCTPDEAAPLAQLILEKTDGNPFFAIQLLVALHEQHLIEFDPAAARWRWDRARIAAHGFIGGIAEFMAARLGRVSHETREALQRLACLGTATGSAMIAVALEATEEEVHPVLAEAVRAGLLLRSGNRYKFLHDRVQEAAYAAIPQEQRAALHLRIGRACIERMSPDDCEEQVFDVVNQFNHGVSLLASREEIFLVRGLNAVAACKAKAAIAYATARNYFERAASLLPDDAWETAYREAFDLHHEFAECDYLSGNIEAAEERFGLLLAKACSPLDRAKVFALRMAMCQTVGRFDEALAAGFEALALFGISCPDDEAEIAGQEAAERARIDAFLRNRRPGDLYGLPVATEPAAIASIELLIDLVPCAFVARNRLYALLTYKAVNMSIQHGNTLKSCLAYSGYGMILGSRFGDVETGHAFSQLGLKLNDKFSDVRMRGALLFVHGNYLNFWRTPFSENVPLMEAAFRASLEVGDLVWAGYASYRTPWQMIERGDMLDEVLAALEKYAAFARQSRNDTALHAIRIERQFIACLNGETSEQASFNGDGFDEAECLQVFERAHFRSGTAFHHVMKQAACFLYRRYGDALDAAHAAAAMQDVMISMPIEATSCFYHALTLAALYTQVDPGRQRESAALLARFLDQHKRWAENCPANYLDRYALLAAEVARIEGRDLDAMQRYEQAIRLAAEQGYVHNEALANELAAYFYRTRGSGRSADAYLRHARDCYDRWGAGGKVRQLESLYPQLKARHRAGAGEALPRGTLQLDALAVIKASQALSGEIAFDRLLAKLLYVVIEQAGAQKGYVILQHGGALVIEAEAALDDNGNVETRRLHSMKLAGSPLLPVSIVNYVWRTRQKVLLENAAADKKFSGDPYIQRHQPKSILCQPIFKQAELAGLLYLENDLITGAFSADALGVLELLSSQAAISLENARLYADLKEENAERRRVERELQLSEAHYRRLFETAKDGILLLNLDTGVLTDANSCLLDMLGYRHDELVGRKLWDVEPFREIDAIRTVCEQLHDRETVRHDNLALTTRDRRELVVEFMSSTYRVNEARVAQCNIRDITGRRHAEQRQAVQFAVTRVLADAQSFADAAVPLLQAICKNLGWEVGELWGVDEAADRFWLVDAWEAPAIAQSDFVASARGRNLSTRAGVSGMAIRERTPLWVPDVTVEPAFRRTQEAARIGVHGCFVVPIAVGAEVLYVLGFFSRDTRVPDAEMIDMMQVVGSQIGQFIRRKRAEQALIRSEERFRSLTNLSSDWYWEQDAQFRFTVMSDGIGVAGMMPEHLIGKTRRDLAIDERTLDCDSWEAHLKVLKEHRPFRNLEYRVRAEDGRWHWFSINGEPLFGDNGEFRGYRGTGKDISDRKQAEELHRGQARVLEMIATGAPLEDVLDTLVKVIESQSDGMLGSVLMLDEDGMHVYRGAAGSLPESFMRVLDGAQIGPGEGSCGAAMQRGERVVVADIDHDPVWSNYRTIALAHGLRACWSTPIVSQQGAVLGAFGMYYREVREPTPEELRLADFAARISGIAIERKQAEHRISYMAHHDALTGLPNRSLLLDRLKQAVAQAQRLEKVVAVMFIDLDYFKHINDSLGHQVGDQLLQLVSMRLQQCLRRGDTLARLGGDEFVLVLPTIDDDYAAAAVAQKILEELKTPFHAGGHELHIGGSIGISLYPGDGDDADELMRAADTAMYHAKAKGRANYQFFTQSLNVAAQRRLVIANQLRQAIARGELMLHYQPQVDMERGCVVSAEALLRWRRADRSRISPQEFIPIAEETGLIVQIGEWVLREACMQLRRWRDAGHASLCIAVNLSVRQLMEPGFVATVERILLETGVPAAALELEITESFLMNPGDDNLVPLIQLSDMGVKLWVDDFGTGYSSLSYLKRFPIHALKIDQSFVRGIGQAQNDAAIINAIIAMAHSLHLKVIAEGVETAEQAAFLQARQCVFAQGFFYSKPVPPEAFIELLEGRSRLSA